jgi:ATP-binding cassette, subfamily B, multidrug efflux pump
VGKTVIAIAHRLSTIRVHEPADRARGRRIVEEGSHEALLALGGHYEKLWRHQSGGFLADDLLTDLRV